MNLLDELSWRGMIQDIMPGTREQLEKEMTTGYIGFDPTADSLHIGSLVPILLLVHFQKAGHKPIALIGGATGMVGDPSGKSEERNLLNEETLQRNIIGVKAQLAKFLNFSPSLPNAAELVNNYDWFKSISFIDFLRDSGKHITVNYMMAKDSVKKRIEGDAGISYTEFAYQLMQAYDFYWLYQHKQCKLQMGGSDQWGNMTTGTELIRRKCGGEAFVFTNPLITKSDGGKFGKTEAGNIWLDPAKTSPYQFYQFWLNASDVDATRWIKQFTFMTQEDIEKITELHEQNPAARTLQRILAAEITSFVHGQEELNKAIETTEKLFSNQQAPIESLTETDLEQIQGIVKVEIERNTLREGVDIVTLLATTGIFSSKGEARKTTQGGGISVNRKKVEAVDFIVNESFLLHNRYILIQKGKKNYFLITVKAI
ncbi:MAG: tyrosine--tRNA ligase [Bacteroidetes bacterium]|nr:tyrosine--tRNA ligase [Bacteroidota bacterium]